MHSPNKDLVGLCYLVVTLSFSLQPSLGSCRFFSLLAIRRIPTHIGHIDCSANPLLWLYFLLEDPYGPDTPFPIL